MVSYLENFVYIAIAVFAFEIFFDRTQLSPSANAGQAMLFSMKIISS